MSVLDFLLFRKPTPKAPPTPSPTPPPSGDPLNDKITDTFAALCAGLDRIEQILREMGYCDDCGFAHERGVRECVDLRSEG